MVAGNESCDLDSIVCALVYAHYKTMKKPSTSIVLPLLQCLRKDLVMNQEACMVFDKLGINASDLVYTDDLSSNILSAAAELSIVLVDHNFPTGERSALISVMICMVALV